MKPSSRAHLVFSLLALLLIGNQNLIAEQLKAHKFELLQTPELPDYHQSIFKILKLGHSAIKEFEQKIKELESLPAEQLTIENSLIEFEDQLAILRSKIDPYTFLANVSSQSIYRKAASRLITARRLLFKRLSASQALKTALDTAIKKTAKPDREIAALHTRLQHSFFSSPHQNAPQSASDLQKLKDKIKNKETKFALNYQKWGDDQSVCRIVVSAEELNSINKDLFSEIKRHDNGNIEIEVKSPHEFLSVCASASARKKLMYNLNTCFSRENVRLLEETLSLRNELAKQHGFNNFAEMTLSEMTCKSPDTVLAFLNREIARLVPEARETLAMLKALKAAEENSLPEQTIINSWDYDYYKNRYASKMTTKSFSVYFPAFQVINKAFSFLERLFNIKFEKIDTSTWHKDVSTFSIRDRSGTIIGYIYLDLIMRPGKMYAFYLQSLVRNKLSSQNARKKVPVMALYGACSSDQPHLMEPNEYRMLLHELGHSLQDILYGSRYSELSGAFAQKDFAEIPSLLIEHFSQHPDTLSEVTSHAETGKALTESQIAELTSLTRNFAAIEKLMIIMNAKYDLLIHISAPDNTSALYLKLQKDILAMPLPDNTTPQTAFFHLMEEGNACRYWAYPFANAVSQKIFARLKDVKHENRDEIEKYRKHILELPIVDARATLSNYFGYDVIQELIKQ